MLKESIRNETSIAQLKAERDRLRKKLAAIEADYRKGLAPDSEDRAIDLENAEVLEAISKSTAEELEKIGKQLSELR